MCRAEGSKQVHTNRHSHRHLLGVVAMETAANVSKVATLRLFERMLSAEKSKPFTNTPMDKLEKKANIHTHSYPRPQGFSVQTNNLFELNLSIKQRMRAISYKNNRILRC